MLEAKRAIPVARYEPRDVRESFIWWALATLLAVLLGCAALVRALYPDSVSDRILTLPLAEAPAPRLQPNPAADFQRFHEEEMRALESSGWIDRTHGIIHIPIERAMQLVASEGLGDWPSPGTPAAPTEPGGPPPRGNTR